MLLAHLVLLRLRCEVLHPALQLLKLGLALGAVALLSLQGGEAARVGCLGWRAAAGPAGGQAGAPLMMLRQMRTGHYHMGAVPWHGCARRGRRKRAPAPTCLFCSCCRALRRPRAVDGVVSLACPCCCAAAAAAAACIACCMSAAWRAAPSPCCAA